MSEKREVPGMIRTILKLDVKLTNNFCLYANNFLPLRSLRVHYKILEVSCHGIPWFCGLLAFIWLWDNPDLYQMQINLIWGLLLDVIIVALLKAATRRRRPAANASDMFVTLGPDKFSFPSGHASRASLVAHFFIHLWPVPFIFVPPLLAWSFAVCVSRVLLQRHHILDVSAGALLGQLEGSLLGMLWLSQSSCAWFVSWLSDERLEGASYHV